MDAHVAEAAAQGASSIWMATGWQPGCHGKVRRRTREVPEPATSRRPPVVAPRQAPARARCPRPDPSPPRSIGTAEPRGAAREQGGRHRRIEGPGPVAQPGARGVPAASVDGRRRVAGGARAAVAVGVRTGGPPRRAPARGRGRRERGVAAPRRRRGDTFRRPRSPRGRGALRVLPRPQRDIVFLGSRRRLQQCAPHGVLPDVPRADHGNVRSSAVATRHGSRDQNSQGRKKKGSTPEAPAPVAARRVSPFALNCRVRRGRQSRWRRRGAVDGREDAVDGSFGEHVSRQDRLQR